MFGTRTRVANTRSSRRFFPAPNLAKRLWLEQAAAGQAQPEIEKTLRAEAKALGLWNMALPRLADDEPV